MPCYTRGCLLGNEIFSLITGDWSAIMEIPENCILFAIIWCRTYSKGGNTRGTYFVSTHCGGRLAQQREIHKEWNLLALKGAELGQQVEIQEERILFVQRLHTG